MGFQKKKEEYQISIRRDRLVQERNQNLAGGLGSIETQESGARLHHRRFIAIRFPARLHRQKQ